MSNLYFFSKTGRWNGWARFARIKGLDEHTFMFDSRMPHISLIYVGIGKYSSDSGSPRIELDQLIMATVEILS